MDHHGLINLSRTILTEVTQKIQRDISIHTWGWDATPVIQPESHCPFCSMVIRSPFIWFLNGANNTNLIGVLPINRKNSKFVLHYPSHPHSGRPFCLGKNKTGVEVLLSTVNLDDSSMPRVYIPCWIAKYWAHKCLAMYDYINNLNDYDTHRSRILKELDEL
jgi:hypothetical protein